MSSGSSAHAVAHSLPTEIKVGTELHGRYVISAFLGSGGYATVWRATDKKEARDVAIKRLNRSNWAAISEDDIKKVLEEATNTSRLKGHKNIVEVYETFQENGEAFIVMEYVDGTTLEAVFREHALKNTWVETDEALDFFKQLMEGLVFAHSSGLIHRDIKPANILISKLGVLKLADFGIAKQMPWEPHHAPVGKTGFAGTGSQPFMSHEQARGENLDQRTDIFSAGIIGYLLFTGKHPFNHPSAAFSIFDLIREPGFKCDEITPKQNLPESVRKAVTRMLSKDRTLRYNSIYEPLGELSRGNSQQCPQCSTPNPIASNFCGQCGNSLKVKTSEPLAIKAVSDRTASDLTDEGFDNTKVERWDLAIDFYQQAIAKDPAYGRAYANLGFALNRLGKYVESIDILTRGLAQIIDQNVRHRLFDSRGFARSNLKDFHGAIDDFTDALKLNEHNPRVLYHRAESWAQIGDLKEAYDDVTNALDLDPNYWPALRLKGRLDRGGA